MQQSNSSYYLDIEAWKKQIGVDYIKAIWCFEFPERDESLPDVLLIGDSISRLYTVALPHMRERDVHFSDEASEVLGRHVAKVIKAALPSEQRR